MRNFMAFLAILVPLAVTPAAADHVRVDVETLNGWCQPYEAGTLGSEARCYGYINSVANTLARGILVHGHRACFPKNVPVIYLRIITIAALDDRTEDDHMGARDWTARVLSEAFPC